MKYVGLQTQIWRNNFKSTLLLLMFPLVFFILTWLFLFFTVGQGADGYDPVEVSMHFVTVVPWVAAGVVLWFVIAWFSHTSMINSATGSKLLERKENKRVYNLVENLCIAAGMKMPAVNIMEDDSLNAFASGISEKSYAVSLSRGIIEKLNDEELEAVIAHELTHIRNRDVRLLIISVIFVGIFAFLAEAIMRSMFYGRGRVVSGGGGNSKGKGGAGILIALALAMVGYLISSLFRFAISRKREYMADAGAAALTRNPRALASALRKVSGDPAIEAVKRKDVAQMFIENPSLKKDEKSMPFSSMFATHPPIEQRIKILEQF